MFLNSVIYTFALFICGTFRTSSFKQRKVTNLRIRSVIFNNKNHFMWQTSSLSLMSTEISLFTVMDSASSLSQYQNQWVCLIFRFSCLWGQTHRLILKFRCYTIITDTDWQHKHNTKCSGSIYQLELSDWIIWYYYETKEKCVTWSCRVTCFLWSMKP